MRNSLSLLSFLVELIRETDTTLADARVPSHLDLRGLTSEDDASNREFAMEESLAKRERRLAKATYEPTKERKKELLPNSS